MAIQPINNISAGAPSVQQEASSTMELQGNAEPSLNKAERNAALLQASQRLSFSAGNEPMALLYKAAVDAINERLAADFGPDAIQQAVDSGLDVSPEATAGRIVSMSTAFFPAYQQQHPELDYEEQLDGFLSIISSGIDQGFAEARDILDGLQVLAGEIADNIDKTYDDVQSGLADFRKRMLASQSG